MGRRSGKEDDSLAYYDSIYQDQELGHRAKTVYIYLKDHANKEGTCWPGIKTIAAGVSLSRSTVKRALDGAGGAAGEVQPVEGEWEPDLQPLPNQIILFTKTPI